MKISRKVPSCFFLFFFGEINGDVEVAKSWGVIGPSLLAKYWFEKRVRSLLSCTVVLGGGGAPIIAAGK